MTRDEAMQVAKAAIAAKQSVSTYLRTIALREVQNRDK